MRILLINPNRVQSPPVPPIGLEYIASALADAGHDVRIADLCFESDPIQALKRVIDDFGPELAGLTVRNIDSVLFADNEFFLDWIRDIVTFLKGECGLRVFAGGSGLTADPEGVLDLIGADAAISGNAESVIPDFVEQFSRNALTSRIYSAGFHPGCICRRDTGLIDYRTYFKEGGIAGFETHRGCSSSCIYCLEANTPVLFRDFDVVVREIRSFVEQGFDRFHLCDPEFNEDLDRSIEFCERLRASGLSMAWSLYMKPANYNQKLFRLMQQTGVNLITLTVDSFKKCPLYWNDIEKIIFSARNFGMRIYVDFLTGFPYEESELLKWCLDFFRRLQPDRVNINTYIRLYRGLFINRILSRDPSLRQNVIGNIEDITMIRPVFYHQILDEDLASLITDDPLFCISSGSNAVNYLRIR